MQVVDLRPDDHVVVCDGRKALFFTNKGSGQHIDLQLRDKRERTDASTVEQGSDAPGRKHASIGAARSAVAQTDWHDRDEQLFLRELARDLDETLGSDGKPRLVVVAPPRALAVLRKAWSRRVQNALIAEIGKDLVDAPKDAIEAYFAPLPRHAGARGAAAR